MTYKRHNNLDFIKIKNFCSARQYQQAKECKKIFVKNIPVKGLVSKKYTKNSKNSTTTKNQTTQLKMGQRPSQTPHQRYTDD